MKIFVSVKAPHGDEFHRTTSQALENTIRDAGHIPFVAWEEIESKKLPPKTFMPFVREQLKSCDFLLVLHHPELRGGLIELGIAYALGIPIWLACRKGEHVSSSALGCADKLLEYSSLGDLQRKLLEQIKLLE